jgi:hypothetical protein
MGTPHQQPAEWNSTADSAAGGTQVMECEMMECEMCNELLHPLQRVKDNTV